MLHLAWYIILLTYDQCAVTQPKFLLLIMPRKPKHKDLLISKADLQQAISKYSWVLTGAINILLSIYSLFSGT